jgi:hypothetical protein
VEWFEPGWRAALRSFWVLVVVLPMGIVMNWYSYHPYFPHYNVDATSYLLATTLRFSAIRRAGAVSDLAVFESGKVLPSIFPACLTRPTGLVCSAALSSCLCFSSAKPTG